MRCELRSLTCLVDRANRGRLWPRTSASRSTVAATACYIQKQRLLTGQVRQTSPAFGGGQFSGPLRRTSSVRRTVGL